MNENDTDIVDLEACHEHADIPPGASRFRLRIDNDRHVIDDPQPTGRQLLTLMDSRPVDEYLIFMVLRSGVFEEIRLDETVDLVRPGIERFITFESAASYRLVLDGERLEYGTPLITGLRLKELAGVDPETYALWLEVRGGEDEPIANDQVVDLSQKGLERFFTVIEETTAGQPAVLPSGDREYLVSHSYRFDEITEGSQRGVVIKDHGLPNPKLSEGHADVLILLPNGYPDVPPDMFYCLPWLKLAESDRYPERADNPFQFAGHSWQRWSRHNQEWRPGKDGIWTMLRRVDRALAEAG